jgi:simple sugar transport system ATP-binding protein
MLGLASTKAPFLDKAAVKAELETLMNTYHIRVDLEKEILDLSVGAQQKVEILKMLYRKSRLLIMDEPTAVLTPQETEELFVFIRQFRDQGNSIVLITHKIEEVLEISNRITVMRAGKNVGTFEREEISDKSELAYLMVGKKIELTVKNVLGEPEELVPVLEVQSLKVEDNRGLVAVHDVSFEIYKGEILGIAGVSGNGQTELAEALTGLRPCKSGRVLVNGDDIANLPPREIQERNVRHIPGDRHRHGLVLDFSVKENMLLGRFYDEPYSTKGRINHSYNSALAAEKITEYDIRTSGMNALTKSLSGGNQQKLILSRELAIQPEILIAVQPTRGLDIGAAKFVQQRILEQKEAGAAILYISTELEEIMDMSDRIMVFFEGESVCMYNAHEVDSWKLGLLMTGCFDGEEPDRERGEAE